MTTTLTRPSEIAPAILEGGTDLATFLPGVWTCIGWIAPDGMTRESYIATSDVLWEWLRGEKWCIGDFIIYGEDNVKWGETYAQAMEVTGLSYERLAHIAGICRRFQFCRRRQNLYFAHHEAVSAKRFTADDQDYWLDIAERNKQSASELKRQVASWEQEAHNDKLAADGIITDVEPVQAEPQFKWLDQDTGEIVDDPGDDGPESVVPLVTCPHCGVPFPWRGISIQQEGA